MPFSLAGAFLTEFSLGSKTESGTGGECGETNGKSKIRRHVRDQFAFHARVLVVGGGKRMAKGPQLALNRNRNVGAYFCFNPVLVLSRSASANSPNA